MDYISVESAKEQLGISHAQLRQALAHGYLDGRKNGSRQWIYISAPSLARYQSDRAVTLPAGYITPEQTMHLTGWTWEPIRARLSAGAWHGVKNRVSGWIGILEADILRDVARRCKRCEILLSDAEPGPVCDWCAVGGTDCAGRVEARPMAVILKPFPVEKRLDI